MSDRLEEINKGLLEKNVELEQKNQTYKNALEEIIECIDGFYDHQEPRRLFPELRKFAGFIQVMDKVANDALKK